MGQEETLINAERIDKAIKTKEELIEQFVKNGKYKLAEIL